MELAYRSKSIVFDVAVVVVAAVAAVAAVAVAVEQQRSLPSARPRSSAAF